MSEIIDNEERTAVETQEIVKAVARALDGADIVADGMECTVEAEEEGDFVVTDENGKQHRFILSIQPDDLGFAALGRRLGRAGVGRQDS